jgi:uncharacterized membrane protein
MDFFPILLLALGLAAAIFGLPIAALVVARKTGNTLRREIQALSERVRSLEAQLARLGQPPRAASEPAPAQPEPALPALRPAPQAAPTQPTPAVRPILTPIAAPAPQPTIAAQPAPPSAPAVPAPPLFASVAPPRFGHAEAAHAEDPRSESRSLENRIGSQWFNRVGILAVLIAVAWFLKLAFDNHWIGPLGRVFIGLVAGAGLIAWSERFEKRGYTAFAYALKAVGSGTLYLSLWAAFSLYALIPAWAAFLAMIAVTAFNGFVSWARNAELLALYAIAGGLGTPLLVSTGGNHEITLLTYLLILNLAVLVLVALRPWSRLLFATFVGTVLLFAGWWMEFYSVDQQVSTAFFLTCFFLIYAFAPRLARPRGGSAPDLAGGSDLAGWDILALVLLPIATAALAFIAYCALFPSSQSDAVYPWIAVAFAAFYLLLVRIPVSVSSSGLLRSGPSFLPSLYLSFALVFLTLAIPLKTRGRWLTVGWLTEGAALLWVSSRVRLVFQRVFALLCLLLGLFALLTVNPPASTTPFFNQRFAAYAVAIAVFVFVVWLARRTPPEPNVEPILNWPFLAAASVLIINVLILVAGSWEIHSYWWYRRWAGYSTGDSTGQWSWTLWHNYTMDAHFTYSAFFMAFGAALLSLGFLKRSAYLRWQALILLAATIAKVFLIDTSELAQGLRIVSFLGLGVLLLAVSFVYQRDWLNLRGQGDRTS